MRSFTRGVRLLQDNSRCIPGGLASLNRKTDIPIAFARAIGSRMWDVDGHEYIDYHAGFAPYILGHNDPDVNSAVKEAIEAGLSNYDSAHCVYFADRHPACWWDILESHDFELDAAYRRALIERGIYNFPMPCKQGSISLAHTEGDIDETLAAIDAVLPAFSAASAIA